MRSALYSKCWAAIFL